MEFSGPAALVDLHVDLALNEEEDDQNVEHWPHLLPSPGHAPAVAASEAASKVDCSRLATHAPTSVKRLMDDNSDSGSEAHSPSAKTSKHNQTLSIHRISFTSPPSLTLPFQHPAVVPTPASLHLCSPC